MIGIDFVDNLISEIGLPLVKKGIKAVTGIDLESKELIQRGEVKSYYSELTNIARNYIEEEIEIPAMESTTSELILALRKVANQKKLKL